MSSFASFFIYYSAGEDLQDLLFVDYYQFHEKCMTSCCHFGLSILLCNLVIGFGLSLKLRSWSVLFFEKHYVDLSSKPFFNGLVEYIISGSCCCNGLGGQLFGKYLMQINFVVACGNVIHGSDALRVQERRLRCGSRRCRRMAEATFTLGSTNEFSSESSLQPIYGFVNYDKLCGTILERYTLSVPNDDQVRVQNVNAEFVVQMEEQMNEAGNIDVELENREASFDCWKPDSPYGGHVDSEPSRQVLEGVCNVLQQKRKRSGRGVALEDFMPNLFPDLLELSSTPAAAGDGKGERLEADLTNAWLKNKELEECNRRKSVQINELEARVDVMERIIGKKAVNLFIGFDNIITAKDAEMARLRALVTQLDRKVAILEDQVDDHETHAVTQAATHIESSKRQPTEDQVEMYGSCNDSHVSRTERNSVDKTLRSTSTIPMGAVCIEVGDAVEVESPLKKTPSEINRVSSPQGCPAIVVVDTAVIWDGRDNGMRVYFSDIQALVQQSCVSGKVIDAYAAILTVLQRKCGDEVNNVDSCYFFSSICAKQWVVKYHNRIMGVGAKTTNVAPPYIDETLEFVMDCPQQAADT
ncbi:hypothetical protein LOK49_Contig3G00019 [Camellia lanceoleosa]|nr:hypothetical protein LOK49_Contig3G00019 [Camellia lanceoleosa]